MTLGSSDWTEKVVRGRLHNGENKRREAERVAAAAAAEGAPAADEADAPDAE